MLWALFLFPLYLQFSFSIYFVFLIFYYLITTLLLSAFGKFLLVWGLHFFLGWIFSSFVLFCFIIVSMIPFPFLAFYSYLGSLVQIFYWLFSAPSENCVVASTLWFEDGVFCVLSQIFSGLRAWWSEGRTQLRERLVISELWPHF